MLEHWQPNATKSQACKYLTCENGFSIARSNALAKRSNERTSDDRIPPETLTQH
jgi:hypothetical protein